MVTDGKYTYCSVHFEMYVNVEALHCTTETIMSTVPQ